MYSNILGGLSANKDLNIILQYLNPTGNGILRNPDLTLTRTRKKPGLKENPDSDWNKNPDSCSRKAGHAIRKPDSKLRKTGSETAFRILKRLD